MGRLARAKKIFQLAIGNLFFFFFLKKVLTKREKYVIIAAARARQKRAEFSLYHTCSNLSRENFVNFFTILFPKTALVKKFTTSSFYEMPFVKKFTGELVKVITFTNRGLLVKKLTKFFVDLLLVI